MKHLAFSSPYPFGPFSVDQGVVQMCLKCIGGRLLPDSSVHEWHATHDHKVQQLPHILFTGDMQRGLNNYKYYGPYSQYGYSIICPKMRLIW